MTLAGAARLTAAIGYDAAKRTAETADAAGRAALAGQPDLAPELLYFLAADAHGPVRAAVAANPATPARADSLLAADADPGIRALVGRKLALQSSAFAPAAAPGIPQDRLRRLAWRTLCDLAADTAILVRAVIAEELKAMPDAPRALILQLAQDTAMEVAEPVIRFSPQLTEADLLALVARPPVPETVTAIARRPQLSEALCDAIIAHADPGTVGVLLENPTAAIRESALDALIANAAEHTGWQERLVRRPRLPAGAALALAVFIAGHLLEALATRPDLDPGLARTLRQRVEQRLVASAAAPIPLALPPMANPPTPAGPPESAFEAAGLRGDQAAMATPLCAAAGVPAAAVEQAVRLRSAKGLVSLCWQAGFTPHAGTLAQSVLGHLPPGGILPVSAAGGWPLSQTEMLWQIELLAEREV